MQRAAQIHLSDVQAAYSGPERQLWELLMGEQIHLGGLQSSLDLAERAGLQAGQAGIDLCCATGAGMRFLLRFRKVARMTGVDATPAMITLGKQRSFEQGLGDRIIFVEADVCATGLPGGQADFVWGEDAWCYVEDKPKLIAEAARLVKPGGRIAFTDWLEGPSGLTGEEGQRYLRFMKFPNVLKLEEYTALLQGQRCAVIVATDTGRFAGQVPLYLDMIEKQLGYDALRILGFDSALAGAIHEEMRFLGALAKAGKVIQGLIVAQKAP